MKLSGALCLNIRLQIIHGEFVLRFGRIGWLRTTRYAKYFDLLELWHLRFILKHPKPSRFRMLVLFFKTGVKVWAQEPTNWVTSENIDRIQGLER